MAFAGMTYGRKPEGNIAPLSHCMKKVASFQRKLESGPPAGGWDFVFGAWDFGQRTGNWMGEGTRILETKTGYSILDGGRGGSLESFFSLLYANPLPGVPQINLLYIAQNFPPS